MIKIPKDVMEKLLKFHRENIELRDHYKVDSPSYAAMSLIVDSVEMTLEAAGDEDDV